MDIAESKVLARGLAAKGRYEKAEVLYRQVLTRVPRDASVWVRHAEVLKRLGRGQKAAWSYRTAATILVSLAYDARAIACLKLALELQPDDIDLVSELIRVEMHRAQRRLSLRHDAPPKRVVPLSTLEEPQLALPMLEEVDARPSSESVIVQAPPLPPEEPIAPAPPEPEAPQPPVEISPSRSLQTWPQVRRISDLEVAIKSSPTSPWLVLTSGSPIEVRFSDVLSIDQITTFVG